MTDSASRDEQAVSAGDDERIIEHLGMIRAVARRVAASVRRPIDLEDLVQLGVLGLLSSLERYDPDSGVALATYAYHRVRGAMIDGIGAMTGMRRHQARRLRELAASNEYMESLSDSADEMDDAAFVATAITGVFMVNDFAELQDAASDAEDDGVSYGSSPEGVLGRRQLRSTLTAVLARLPDDESHLLTQHYIAGRALSDVAQEMGISRSWASRIHTRGLARAREVLHEEHQIDYGDL